MQYEIKKYDDGVNFWEAYPQLLLIKDLKDFKKKEKNSSDICWKIVLCYHPGSDLYDLSGKEEEIFGKEYASFMDKYSVVISKIKDLCIPQFLKSLISWNDRMNQRDEFLSLQKYHFDYYNDEDKLIKGNSDQLDKMNANTFKLYQDYFKIKEMINLESSKASVTSKGGLGDSDDF